MNNDIMNDAVEFVNNVGLGFDTLSEFTKTLGEGIIENRRTIMTLRDTRDIDLELLSDRIDHITQSVDILVANLAKLLKVSEYEIL